MNLAALAVVEEVEVKEVRGAPEVGAGDGADSNVSIVGFDEESSSVRRYFRIRTST